MDGTFACPVCGHLLDAKPYETWPPPEGITLVPPYSKQLGDPSYDVCARCGFEFGHDDEPVLGQAGDSFEQARAEWEAEGRPWFDEGARPAHDDTN